MHAFVINVLQWLPIFRYPAIVFVAMLEGPVLSLFCGFFLKLGYVSFWPVYLSLMLGDLLGDLAWYYIGYRFLHPFIQKFGRYFSVDQALVTKVEDIFHRRHSMILFFSKITMGFGFAVVILMVAGKIRLSLRKFIFINTFGQFVWTGFLLGIGYFFGNLYLSINQDLQLVSLIAFIVTVLAAIYGFSRYLKQKKFENIL